MCSVSVVPGLAMQPLVFRGSLPTARFCAAEHFHYVILCNFVICIIIAHVAFRGSLPTARFCATAV